MVLVGCGAIQTEGKHVHNTVCCKQRNDVQNRSLPVAQYSLGRTYGASVGDGRTYGGDAQVASQEDVHAEERKEHSARYRRVRPKEEVFHCRTRREGARTM
jgi:hypothetical protein